MSDFQNSTQPQNPFAAPNEIPADAIDEMSPQDLRVAELRAFVGRKADHYMKKWAKVLQSGGYDSGFNWAAFFIGPFWSLYRKMYAVSFALMGISILEAILEEIVFVEILEMHEVSNAVYYGTDLAFSILTGMFANRLYLWHAERKIAAIRAQGHEGDQRLWKIEQSGGTSMVPVVVLFIFVIIFAGLLS